MNQPTVPADEGPAAAEVGHDLVRTLGVVVIGRNEGDRLLRCLRSVRVQTDRVVYADSGSSDRSVERARELGIFVAELAPSHPLTAAAARNLGFETLIQRFPGVELVQFLDGDCQLQPGWLHAAASYLEEHPGVAVVCGHRREFAARANFYHRLADMEWASGVGDTLIFAGDAMIRARTLSAVDGFDASLIAGEEPDLCARLRRRGFRIVKIDLEMTLHDIAMHDLRAWWRRNARAGHSYAELTYLHGRSPDTPWGRRLLAAIAWGAALPVLAIGAAPATSGWSLSLFAAYAFQWLRIYLSRAGSLSLSRAGSLSGRADAALYAIACMAGKFAELEGALRFAWNRLLRGRASSLIEYKEPMPSVRARRPPESRSK